MWNLLCCESGILPGNFLNYCEPEQSWGYFNPKVAALLANVGASWVCGIPHGPAGKYAWNKIKLGVNNVACTAGFCMTSGTWEGSYFIAFLLAGAKIPIGLWNLAPTKAPVQKTKVSWSYWWNFPHRGRKDLTDVPFQGRLLQAWITDACRTQQIHVTGLGLSLHIANCKISDSATCRNQKMYKSLVIYTHPQWEWLQVMTVVPYLHARGTDVIKYYRKQKCACILEN